MVRFSRLIKCGWEHMDNSTIMLLRLLDQLHVKEVGIAGLDGYDSKNRNYILEDMEQSCEMGYQQMNDEIEEMLHDFIETRENPFMIRCITKSRFEKVFASQGEF